MKTPFEISELTLNALRPLLFLFVLAAIVAIAVVALPTSPTGAQEPTPTAEPTPSAPVTGISARTSPGGRTRVEWDTSALCQYLRVGYVNLSQFLATAKDDATWGDAIQWRTFSYDCVVGWMSVSGDLTPGDHYAFTVTAAADSTSEQYWPDPNWIVHRVHGGDIATPNATPAPAPTIEPTPTPTGPVDYCDTPFAPLLPQCQ